MISLLRRLLGSDSRSRARVAEEKHSRRVAELDQTNRELEEVNERIANLGSASRREGLALMRTMEEISASLRPTAAESSNGTETEP